MKPSPFADSFPPGPNPKMCPIVLGQYQCARRAGHTTFHLCVPFERALELMTPEERAEEEKEMFG